MSPTRQFFRSVSAAFAEIGAAMGTVTVGIGPVTVTLQPRPATPPQPAHVCTDSTCLRCGSLEPPRRS